jgi:hypothetical protein
MIIFVSLGYNFYSWNIVVALCTNIIRNTDFQEPVFELKILCEYLQINKRFFCTPERPDQLWGPSSLLSNGYRWLFPRW